MSQKKLFVEDLQRSIGMTGDSLFVLTKLEKRTTKAGKPFLDLKLQDKTGEVSGKVWSDNIDHVDDSKVGDVVAVQFEVNEYQSRAELVIRALKKTEEYEQTDFIAVPDEVDYEAMRTEFLKRLDSVRDIHLRSLLDNFFDDEEFWEQYSSTPAAASIHHAHQHGLLKHCLEMMAVVDSVTQFYTDLNKDLVITGIMLHDIGKLRENDRTKTGAMTRSFEGKLVGHLGLGLFMIHERLPKDFPEELRVQIDHILLSHHGKPEWGSPVHPATREAMVIHLADMVSSYINITDNIWRSGRAQLTGNMEEKEAKELFTEFNRYLNTSLFIGDL